MHKWQESSSNATHSTATGTTKLNRVEKQSSVVYLWTVPKEIIIYETYNPGAIHRVSVADGEQNGSVVWEHQPQAPDAERRELRIDVSPACKTEFVLLEIAGDLVQGFNEIDAVALVDATTDQKVWATRAACSTTYASGKINPKFAADSSIVSKLVSQRHREAR